MKLAGNPNGRVALCLFGYVGCLNKYRMSDAEIDITEAYEYYKKNVLKDHDIDIFIHSFDIKRKDEIIDTYKPINFKIEKQRQKFKVDHIGYGDSMKSYSKHTEGYSSKQKQVFHNQSQKYSRKQSIILKRQHETKHKFEYDLVLTARLDIAFTEEFEFHTLDPDKLYAPGNNARHPNMINEFFFCSNSKNIDKIGEFYDNMAEHGLDSQTNIHIIEMNYIKKTWPNFEDILEYYLIRPWSAAAWHGSVRIIRTKPNVRTVVKK